MAPFASGNIFDTGGAVNPYMSAPEFLGDYGGMATMGGSMLANMLMSRSGGFVTNPFGPGSGASDYLIQQRMRPMMFPSPGGYGAQFERDYIASLFDKQAAGKWGSSTFQANADAVQLAGNIQRAVYGPMGIAFSAMTGMDLGMLLPGATINRHSIGALMAIGGTASVTPENVGRMSDAVMSLWRDSANPAEYNSEFMRGLMPGQIMDLTRSLAARGYISGTELLTAGDLGTTANILKRNLSGYTGALSAARSITGSNDVSTNLSALEAIAGGSLTSISNGDIEQSVEKFKEISRQANVSAKAMVDLIQSTVAIAKQYNIDSSVASTFATEGLITSRAAAEVSRGMNLDGLRRPGIAMSNNEFFEMEQRHLLASSGSPVANRTAIAALQLKRAGKLDAALKDGEFGAALGEFLDGNTTGEHANLLLKNSSGLAAFVARHTGMSTGAVASSFLNTDFGRIANAYFPNVGRGAMLANLPSILNRGHAVNAFRSELSGKSGKLSNDEFYKVIAAAATEGEDLSVTMEGLAAAGIKATGKGSLENILLRMSGVIQGPLREAAQLWAGKDKAAAALATANKAAALNSVFNKVLSGADKPLMERFLSGIATMSATGVSAEEIARILGGQSGGDVLNALGRMTEEQFNKIKAAGGLEALYGMVDTAGGEGSNFGSAAGTKFEDLTWAVENTKNYRDRNIAEQTAERNSVLAKLGLSGKDVTAWADNKDYSGSGRTALLKSLEADGSLLGTLIQSGDITVGDNGAVKWADGLQDLEGVFGKLTAEELSDPEKVSATAKAALEAGRPGWISSVIKELADAIVNAIYGTTDPTANPSK